MLIKEFYRTREDGVELCRTYSDEGKAIRKVGTDEIYDEAIDVADAPFTYEETGEIYDEAIDVEGVPFTYEETDTPLDGGNI